MSKALNRLKEWSGDVYDKARGYVRLKYKNLSLKYKDLSSSVASKVGRYMVPLILALVYVAVTLLMAVFVVVPNRETGQEAAKYVAAKILVRDHRLSIDDLRIPKDLRGGLYMYLPSRSEMDGMYIRGKLAPGQSLTWNNLQSVPWFLQKTAPPNLLWVPIDPSYSAVLDPGQQIHVCSSSECYCKNAPVVGVVCKTGTKCFVLVESNSGDCKPEKITKQSEVIVVKG